MELIHGREQHKQCPLFVTHDTKTNKMTCDDCPAWTSFKICSHTLAVAETIGKFISFFLWQVKMNPSPNLTSFVTSDSGKDVRGISQRPQVAEGGVITSLPAQ